MQLPGPGVWGEPPDRDRARAVLRRVVELGIGLIDTSWYYGPLVANRLIAETLRPYPQGLVLATKLGGRRTPDKGWAPALRPEELKKGCEEDLRTLQLDQLDVVHLRWIGGSGVTFEEALDAMIALQVEGKIRHLALSNVTLAQVEAAIARTPIVAVQNLYNAAAGEARLAEVPHAVVAQQDALVDLCAARGMAFLPFFPLAIPGFNASHEAIRKVATSRGATPSQIALAWMLARSPSMLPIPGTSSIAHLEQNWDARSIELSPAEIESISRAR
jgi:aryl-alcohol dehydrogenase-like predicted oxidoreductase